MQRELYHGTKGDNIVRIVRDGQIKPGADGRIFFSQWHWDWTLMHGVDDRRGAAFALKLLVNIPDDVRTEKESTSGVADTLVVHTAEPLEAKVLVMYVRKARATTAQTIQGTSEILKYLSA